MNVTYKINQDIDVPIYQQLVDIIESAIKKGDILYGEKLPTVQDMIETLGVARGTVKKAYDELELKGLIQKSQGRGTFVAYRPTGAVSRKEQATAAIDSLFAELENMGFSASEINIFVNLKLRELSEEESLIKVAVVEDSHETLSCIADSLRCISMVDIYTFSLENIKQYPYRLGDDFDLVITTPAHSDYLETVLPPTKKPLQLALRASIDFLSDLVKCACGKRLGGVLYSEAFGEIVMQTCISYAKDAYSVEPFITSANDSAGLSKYLAEVDALIVPKDYARLFPTSITSAIACFSGDVIEAYYEPDDGSMLYLDKKIKKLYEAKNV